MLDTYILDKVGLISYTTVELTNIESTISYLKSIINTESDFKSPLISGSYKRGTMVKGISDVDIYFQYTGTGNPQSALAKLKNCLTSSYPSSIIKQDKPSILADFNKIPVNITPYKADIFGKMSIPDNYLINWQQINLTELESATSALKKKNPNFISLIKILKLWNSNYKKGLKNFEIEKRICNAYVYNNPSSNSISDWMWTFFNNNGFNTDANKFFSLMKNNYSDAILKTEWLKFIDNK